MIEVSIVIVCMNNLKNLYPCLDSIRKYTTVSYETLVVAYLFTKENLDKARRDYPWVTFIESNEIRGFSENNNLALKQARGRYCFVVNDDTEMKMPVIDRLVSAFQRCPDSAAIVSPCILNFKGEVSACGVPPQTIKRFLLTHCHLWPKRMDGVYINQTGLFKTYNITGAAFLIKTNVFREMGWFDERYFFCPEDIALSTKLNEHGFTCHVDADTVIYHYEGMSGKSLSMIQTATKPAATLGDIAFLSRGNKKKALFLRVSFIAILLIRFLYHGLKGLRHPRPNVYYILAVGDINSFKACFSRKTPKETFVHYYSRIHAAKL